MAVRGIVMTPSRAGCSSATSANMPGRRTPSGLGRSARSLTVRVATSMPGLIAATRPSNRSPGAAAAEILEVVGEAHDQLVVMGRRGWSAVERFLFGDRAFLAQHLDVAVVPGPSDHLPLAHQVDPAIPHHQRP